MSSTSLVVGDGGPAAGSPTLETLVPRLLAAKRSLSCVEHVSHANDLVTSTRKALENHTILTARTLFIRNGCKAQTATLDRVHTYSTSIARETGDEFHDIIDRLDAAEAKLRKTLEHLRSTPVDRNLRPENEESKHLVDFVDETGVQTLMANIKESIDTTGKARKGFDQALRTLQEETLEVKELLAFGKGTADGSGAVNEFQSPVPEMLHSLEVHASDMAKNLESLVQHFDLCVTAIKHTEGGGAAALKIARDLPGGMDLNLATDDAPVQPISDEEMTEMLEVLEKDSSEVDEAVGDIRESLAEMEADAEQVRAFGAHIKNEFSKTTKAFHLLEDLGNRLPSYITQSQIFTYRWDEEKAKIEEYMNDLENLRTFYANFILAYDSLLIEVGRRKDVEKRVARIRQEAFAKIDRLVQEEVEERQAFRQDQGEFLPVDIWPGLTASPARYELNKIEGTTDSIPDISASVINKAIKRISAHQKDKSSGVY